VHVLVIIVNIDNMHGEKLKKNCVFKFRFRGDLQAVSPRLGWFPARDCMFCLLVTVITITDLGTVARTPSSLCARSLLTTIVSSSFVSSSAAE